MRRDVAAFVGIAPRGPTWQPAPDLEPDVDVASWLTTAPMQRSVPVAVSSWDEYRHVFGGYEGPGRLPYAVSAFFAGGGRLAYVVRIVHDYSDEDLDLGGRACGVLGELQTLGNDSIELTARSEGTWGNRLRATLRFSTRPIVVRHPMLSTIEVDRHEWVPVGSLLRLDLGGGMEVLQYVDSSSVAESVAGPGLVRVLGLAGLAPVTPVAASVVTATLEVVDHDPAYPRREVLGDLGLRADHPRWLARVIARESAMVWPTVSWANATIRMNDARLEPVTLVGADDADHMTDGTDRWADVHREDFFDPFWVSGDEQPGDGIHALVDHDDIGLLVVPDIYDPLPLDEPDDVADPATFCGPDFAVHVETVAAPPESQPPAGLDGLRLDPADPDELGFIVEAQQALVAEADRRRDLTVLLDVPLGLPASRVLEWRNHFDSPYAAAYHPWLDVAAPDDSRDALVRINPSVFAAGIIASSELRLGVQHGPANELARGAVRPAAVITSEDHDQLHPAGINVFQPERDGIRLSGARTLSRRIDLRQLSVARLITVLRLTLEREMAWAVFEPNHDELWAEIRRLVHDLLTRFYEAGAFVGATTREAFFVRCDRTTMTRNDLDNGRLVCLVGVAPAEPLEYIVIEFAVAADGRVTAEVTA